MSAFNTTTKYGGVAKTLHWLMALLIVAAWYSIETSGDFDNKDPAHLEWILLHKSLGFSVFILLWLRLSWRLYNPVPAPLPAPKWQLRAATWVHIGLYVVMFAMPFTGIMMSQYAGYPISFFGLFEIPVFVTKSPDVAKQIKDIHEDVCWPILLALVAVHIGGAWWHQLVQKDGTIKRMLPFIK